MIGILCNHKREKALTKSLHKLFVPLIKEKDIQIIVFSLSNVNLLEKTVFGNLITAEEEIKSLKTDLPLVIFNFSIQHTRVGVKKLRVLMEIEDLKLFNTVNQYNQWTIMEMLYSNSKTKSLILSYANIDKEDITQSFSNVDNFLLKPEIGHNLSPVIYGKQYNSHYDLYSRLGKRSCHKFDVESVITPYMYSGKWLLLDTPDLITYRNKLFVLRSYLQKNAQGDWEVLSKTSVPPSISIYQKLDKKIDDSSLQIINFINCFIPELCIGFIDFIIDTHSNIYFLNLGGLDRKLLSKKQYKSVRTKLCLNILGLSETLMGRDSHVD